MGHNRMSRTFPYAARVYDGPCEGDFIESDAPYYQAMVYRRISVDPFDRAGIEADRVLYSYSRDIRAWVWVQPEKRDAR